MPQVAIPAATIVADEAKDLIRAQDDSLLANQILFVSVLKTARDSGLPFKDQQKVYAALHETSTKMLDARWAVGDALKVLRGLAKPCGAEVVMEGCSAPCPISSEGDNPIAAVKQPGGVATPSLRVPA